MGAREQWGTTFKEQTEINCQTRCPYTMNTSFDNEDEIKDLSEKQTLKVLITNRPALKDNFQEEGENYSR